MLAAPRASTSSTPTFILELNRASADVILPAVPRQSRHREQGGERRLHDPVTAADKGGEAEIRAA